MNTQIKMQEVFFAISLFLQAFFLRFLFCSRANRLKQTN